jgi:hypothetical protein
MKSIEYPLLATTMTKNQLDIIMRPILMSGLPRAGICRNMARIAIFASTKYQGLGLRHPHITQGLRKLILFGMVSEATYTLSLIQISWNHCKWECGLGINFLSAPFTKKARSLITPGWITSLWEFLSTYKLSIRTTSLEALRFRDDCLLMDKVLSAPQITAGEHIQAFNICRQYL